VFVDEVKYREAEELLWQGVGYEPSEQVITLATTGTKARVQLVGDGPPVLFIHGGPNAGSTWAPIVDAFDGYTCLLIDRPGTGLSEPFPGVSAPEVMFRFGDRFVDDVLVGLGLDRAHVVASSFGGYLALRSAAATPHRFDRMVQMACPAMVPGMLTPPFMRLMSMTWFRRLTGALPPSPKVSDNILRQIGHGKSLDAGRIPQPFKDWYLDLQRYTDTMKNDGEMIGAAASLRGFDPAITIPDELLSSVTVPTLFLWGEDDGFGGRDVADNVVALMPNAELVMMSESGHLPWLDFPDEIGRQTRAFLDGT
jgi:2-hydroxy-6-oxonona-2,4-dienedioate hydrolase/4,5:9,10-diseco-3-hydroxy-5,9,17-trioxoandrosta-1(10),2-diene-4-oate hydrolase